MTPGAGPSPWTDAVTAARLFAVDPAGIGGISLRASAGPVRDRWLALLKSYLPPGAPIRRLPLAVTDDRLLGGLDLAATLSAGRPIAERGLLAEADGGVLIAGCAERLAGGIAAKLVASMDLGEVRLERDGIRSVSPSHFGVVALDEGLAEDEQPPASLLDRLAFLLGLDHVSVREASAAAPEAIDLDAARTRIGTVAIGDGAIEALCTAAVALGIASLRACILATRVARVAAALDGRGEVAEADLALAARLVLAPRATMMPASEEDEPDPQAEPPPDGEDEAHDETDMTAPEPLSDIVLAAVAAALPPDVLARLRLASLSQRRTQASGKAGAAAKSARRGRPAGVRKSQLRAGVRLDVIETLRAAAPWQAIRRSGRRTSGARRLEIRGEDFRIKRFAHRTGTTTIFAVDASGSSALHRLAEAKGAVELLLADCYVRRDQVALVAFRGKGAELLLPPTRSLARAKRSLAGLPGGGGTPLAAGIEAAAALGEAVRRKGQSPALVVLTDGQANIARDGSPGRARAEADAVAAARIVRASGLTALLVDTSPKPHPAAERLAREMGALYLPLPFADAQKVSSAVRAAIA